MALHRTYLRWRRAFGRLWDSSVSRRLTTHSEERLQEGYDVIIAGGGVMGCSSAYFLARRMLGRSVCVIERDPKYEIASTVLSAGSIRQQFSVRGNIEMCLYSSKFIRNIGEHLTIVGEDPPDTQFVEGGYLFLAPREGEEVLRENYETQRALGAAVELMTPTQLKQKFPWLNTTGITLGSLGVKNEGWFDPWTLLSALRRKAVDMGVVYLHGDVVGVGVEAERATGVEVVLASGEHRTLQCRHLINAGGPWASELALMAGIGQADHANPVMRVGLPVRPRKRMMFVFKCPDGPYKDCPMVVDPSGVHFRREGSGGMFIVGGCPPEEEDRDGAELVVDYSFFEEHLWPVMAERVPAFETLKLQSGWAGYYDVNTFDHNAIIGCHPCIRNLVLVNGFSGHGIQQSPAVGRAVSEIVLDGQTHSIDLREFSFERVINVTPLREKNII